MTTKFRCVRGEGDTKSAELVVYDTIGLDPWSGGGITAKAVTDALAALGDVERLDVRVNSPGGEVSEGTAIYNALARFPGRVAVHVDGLAASIATLVAMAGDEIHTAENAMWMVHQPWTIALGNADDMRRMAGTLDKFWSAMLSTYARRTGRRAETVTSKVDKAGGEWWMTAEEAVAEGFSDDVTAPSDAQAFGLARFRRVPERLAAAAGPSPEPPPRAAPELLEVAAPRVSRAARGDPHVARDRMRRIAAALRVRA